MLKKAVILSLALGMGMAATPIISSADINQPVLKAQTFLADDMNTDSANADNDDNDSSMSSDSDDDSTTTNDDNSDSDDNLSSDATE